MQFLHGESLPVPSGKSDEFVARASLLGIVGSGKRFVCQAIEKFCWHGGVSSDFYTLSDVIFRHFLARYFLPCDPWRWRARQNRGSFAIYTTGIAYRLKNIPCFGSARGDYFKCDFSSDSSSVMCTLRFTTFPLSSTRIMVGSVRIPISLARRPSNPPASQSWAQGSLFFDK